MGWVFRAMGKIAAPFVRWNEILPGALWSAVEANWPGALVLGTVNETMTVLVLLVGARERGRRGVCGPSGSRRRLLRQTRKKGCAGLRLRIV